MDPSDLSTLISSLSTNISDLETSLQPLLTTALSTTASKLPLLDKAKIYVLATYALESILFSSLRLNAIDPKEHHVFRELSRVKEYFGKIKAAETIGQKRSTTVDAEAVGRFVKHGLAGNERYDRERETRRQRERGNAKRKLDEMVENGLMVGSHTRFDGMAKRIRAEEEGGGVKVGSDEAGTAEQSAKEAKKAEKARRRLEKKLAKQSPADSPAAGEEEDLAEADTAADPPIPDPLGAQAEGLLKVRKRKPRRKDRGQQSEA